MPIRPSFRVILILALILAPSALAQEEAPVSAEAPAPAWEPTAIALVRGALIPLGGGSIALEHQLGRKLSLLAGISASYFSNSTTSAGATFDTKMASVGLEPGVRYYLGERALSGVFLGATVPLSLQFNELSASKNTLLGVGVEPHAGVSLRFERLVVQLTFGLDVQYRFPLGEATGAVGSPLGTMSSGLSAGLSGSVALGYAF